MPLARPGSGGGTFTPPLPGREPAGGGGGGAGGGGGGWGTMGANARPSGVRAGGGRGAVGPGTSSGVLQQSLLSLSFHFLLLVAPGARAAGYEVSAARKRK